MIGQTYPFSWTEEQIDDLIDVLEIDTLFLPEQLERVLADLHARRKRIMNDRAAKQAYELDRLMED